MTVAPLDPGSATDADVAGMHAVHIAAMTVDSPGDPQPPLADFASRLHDQRDDQRRHWFMARSGDVVTGYARLWLPLLHNLHAGDVDVVVRPESRRQGTGTALLRAAVAALSAEHPLSLDLPRPVMVNGVADDLHRLAGNLIENALIHTPAGTPVTVSVRSDGPNAVLEVADRGPGVPQAMRERVFERFARGDGDAAPRGSSGLGLAIVRAVTEAHEGRVELGDAEGGGARFVVTLPAADATRSDPTDSVLVQPEQVPETSKEQRP